MTWTWTRAGPREWRVSIDTRPQWKRDAEREMNAAMRKVTPEEMAEFYARHHRYLDPRPMTAAEFAQYFAWLYCQRRGDAP